MTIHTELRFGYTLRDIDEAARLAVFYAGQRGNGVEDFTTARSEICLHLYETDQHPTRWDLVNAGRNAIWATINDHAHHHGYNRRDRAAGPGAALGFCKYWAHARVQGLILRTAEDRAVDHMAVAQIMPMLTPGQQQVLHAIAAHGDYATAAQALGLAEAGIKGTVAKARRTFLYWWHEGEEPSRLWRRTYHRDKRVAA